MKHSDSATYSMEDGSVCTPLEAQPVIVIKNGRRKINPLFEELVKNVPQEIKDRVEKVMTCKWLRNGDECEIKGSCNPDGCLSWEKYKEEEEK